MRSTYTTWYVSGESVAVQLHCRCQVWNIRSSHAFPQLFFNDLTFIDWAHHIINVLIMGIIAECWDWGKGVNATCFFMNGVPGAWTTHDLS